MHTIVLGIAVVMLYLNRIVEQMKRKLLKKNYNPNNAPNINQEILITRVNENYYLYYI